MCLFIEIEGPNIIDNDAEKTIENMDIEEEELSDVKNLKKYVKRIKDDLKEELEKSNAKIKKLNDILLFKEEGLKEEILKLKRDLEDRYKEIEGFQSNLSSKENELEKNEIKISDLEKSLNDKDAKIKVLNENILFKNIELKELKEEILKLKSDLESKDKEVEGLQNNLSSKEKGLDEDVIKISNLEKKLNEKDIEIKYLNENLLAKENEIFDLENKQNKLETESNTKSDIIKQKDSEILKLKDVSSLNNSENKNQIENLKKELIEEKKEAQGYKYLFEKYEPILIKLSEEHFKGLREKLKISPLKTKEDYLRMACLTYNLDISKILYDYYSIDLKKEEFENIDKELIDTINKFFIDENITNWDVFIIPDEKFDKSSMYDIDRPDRAFAKVEKVFCPGVKLKEDRVSLRAVVKGK